MKKVFITICFLITGIITFSQISSASKYIDSITKTSDFSGTILISGKTEVIYKKSFGFANIPFQVISTPNTKYKIASITKAFTAVLTLLLYEEKKLDLDKVISFYLPGYSGPAGSKVTIRQLLNMTSGIRNMDDGVTLESALKNGIRHYQLPHTSDELLNRYCIDSLVDEPGKRFDYNNADYILLGKIIEKVSGQSFDQFLQQKILTPLGMKNSGMSYQYLITDKLADTYFYRDDLKTFTNDLPVYINNWYASGAMYSTVDDLNKFSNTLFGGKLLKPETMKQMFTQALDEYALGVWVYKNYEIHKKMYTIVKRPGSIMGTQTMLFHILEKGATIIVLSNACKLSLDEFVAEIANRLL